MNTDELILSLAQKPAAPALHPGRIGLVMLAVTGLSIAVFLAVFGMRDGLPGLLAQPLIAAKTLLPALACLLALPVLLTLLRPEGRGSDLMRLLLPLALGAGLWGLGFALRPAAERFADATLFSVVECVGLILVIGAVPLGTAMRLLQRGATVRPVLAGALAGLVVGAGAAAGYSFFCLQDNPLFYVTWYGVAIALLTGAGAVMGWRWLRW